MIKYIIFDFDGTLANTLPLIAIILNDLSTKYGYARLTDEQMYRMRDLTIPEIYKQMHVPLTKLPFMLKDVNNQLHSRVSEIKLIDGMKEVLHMLHSQSYLLDIVTSNKKENVQLVLRNNDVDFFDTIESGVTIFGKDKVIKHLLQRQNISSKDCVYIGDEVRDIEAATKLSMKSIAVTWGFNSTDRLAKMHPNYIIHNPSELPIVLKNL